MKPLLIMLLSAALIASTGSKAQGVNAPSSVSANSLSVQPLSGTLFFGPQQREKMDRARKAGVAAATANVDEVPEIASVLNGFVKRSDGQVAIWVDGVYKLVNDTEMAERIQATSVGMDSRNVVAIAPTSSSKPPGSERIKATGIHRKPIPKTKRRAGTAPSRK